MQTTALRALLLNSALSVRRSGACGKFSLLISARMGVGHAGVVIKRSSSRQMHSWTARAARSRRPLAPLLAPSARAALSRCPVAPPACAARSRRPLAPPARARQTEAPAPAPRDLITAVLDGRAPVDGGSHQGSVPTPAADSRQGARAGTDAPAPAPRGDHPLPDAPAPPREGADGAGLRAPAAPPDGPPRNGAPPANTHSAPGKCFSVARCRSLHHTAVSFVPSDIIFSQLRCTSSSAPALPALLSLPTSFSLYG